MYPYPLTPLGQQACENPCVASPPSCCPPPGRSVGSLMLPCGDLDIPREPCIPPLEPYIGGNRGIRVMVHVQKIQERLSGQNKSARGRILGHDKLKY